MTDQTKRTAAFNELLKLTKDPSMYLLAWEDDYHKGGRFREVEWQYPLLCCREGKDKTEILNDVLDRLTWADFPTTIAQMNKEKKLVYLLMEAGANPNLKSGEIFVSFIKNDRVTAALELAKTPDFRFPNGEENKVLSHLAHNIGTNELHHPCYYRTQQALAEEKSDRPWNKEKIKRLETGLQDGLQYHKVWQQDSKDLIYLLFQKGIYPQNNEKLFQALAPVVLEREPDFFEKMRQNVLERIQCAKIPVQIYNALIIREKEKTR